MNYKISIVSIYSIISVIVNFMLIIKFIVIHRKSLKFERNKDITGIKSILKESRLLLSIFLFLQICNISYNIYSYNSNVEKYDLLSIRVGLSLNIVILLITIGMIIKTSIKLNNIERDIKSNKGIKLPEFFATILIIMLVNFLLAIFSIGIRVRKLHLAKINFFTGDEILTNEETKHLEVHNQLLDNLKNQDSDFNEEDTNKDNTNH